MFPNPLGNQLNISFESKATQKISIFMFEADGSSVKSHSTFIKPGYNIISFMVNDLETGVYLVKIVDASGNVTTKKVYKK